MNTEGHFYFEMVIHMIEGFLVLGIILTLVWVKKYGRKKIKKVQNKEQT